MVKHQNDDRVKEGAEISEQISHLRVEVSTRDSEIREVTGEIHACVSSNQTLERETESLRIAISEQQEIRSRQQS